MSGRINSVRVNIRTKRNKQSKRMKKTKRMKRNNYEKRGGLRWSWRRRRGDNETGNRSGFLRRSVDRFRNYMNRHQRLAAEQAEEQARIFRARGGRAPEARGRKKYT